MSDLFYQAANARALGSDRVQDVWTVSQVNALARELLEGSVPALRVAGEISGWRRMKSGHCFFTLKDDRAKLSCVMWSDDARRLPAEPPEGMQVHAFGYATVYERAGRFQLVVRELTAKGDGLYRLAFEKIRRKLEADGLLDPARKRPIPRFPTHVGVVTSLEGAALRDIVTVIRRRAPWTHILVYGARVQGDEAAGSIVRAIRMAAAVPRAQVLIVGRGGGSTEDLWCFNDERVARAIAAAPMPVISAVGHEIDITLADLVADRRAPTPSAAAEAAVPDGGDLERHLNRLRDRLPAALTGVVAGRARRFEVLGDRLTGAMERLLERRRLVLEGFGRRLHALGPIAVLGRGYAVALDDEGRVLRSASEFRPGAGFRLRLRDGAVRARTESVESSSDEAAGRDRPGPDARTDGDARSGEGG